MLTAERKQGRGRKRVIELVGQRRGRAGVVYAGSRDGCETLAAELVAEADLIVPTPLHRSRLFARRYNQAAEIARPLARLTQVRYGPDLLVRRRDTGTQSAKSGRARRLNVRGAFAVPDRARSRIEGACVLLVDDVMTTGATAEACAKALLSAGARAVDLAVVARVREAADLPI